jgi:hypothetical protein
VYLHLNDVFVLMRLVVGRRLPGAVVKGVAAEFRPIATILAGLPAGRRVAAWAAFLNSRPPDDPVVLALDPAELDGSGSVPQWFRRWFAEGLPRPKIGRNGVVHPGIRSPASGRSKGDCRNGRKGRQEPEPTRS